MKPAALLTVAIAALALAGCSSTTTAAPTTAPGTVSTACKSSLEAMAAAPEDVSMDDWNDLIAESTSACPTVDEYMAGVELVPESWWHSDSPIDDKIVITGACLLDATTPMCADAAKNGYDVGN
jgi:hypothetical protein